MSSRAALLALPLAVLLLAPATAAAQGADAQAPVRQVVVPAGVTPGPNFSPAIRSRNVLYVSGQLAPAGTGPTIQEQTRAVMNGIKTVVEAGGSTMDNVVKCTVFLIAAADFAGMNEAYVPFFPSNPPARSTVVVAALVRADAKVEIECIAAVPR